MSGLQLQNRLAAEGALLPLVFVMAGSDVPTAVEFMRRGAVHVLEKPFRSIELSAAIHEAIDLDRDRRRAKNLRTRIRIHINALTRKERQVLELVAAGKSAKAIATRLELSLRAVELRRDSLMKKLEVDSPLELIRFAVIARREIGLGSDLVRSRAVTKKVECL